MKRISVRFLLCGLHCFISFFAIAQTKHDTIQVNLSSSTGVDNLVYYTIPLTKRPNHEFYKGAPACDTFRIGFAIIDKYQYWYNEYKLGRKTQADFRRNIQQFDVDTNSLSQIQIKSYVGVFSGLKGRKKIVIVDTNNNSDFEDETIYMFDTLNTPRKYTGDDRDIAPMIKVRYEVISNDSITSKYTYVRLKPYDDSYGYQDSIEKKLAVYTVPFTHKKGVFKLGNESFKIALIHQGNRSIADYRMGSVKIQRSGQEFQPGPPRSIEKIINIDNRLIKIIDCAKDGSVISLVDMGITEYGNRVNDLVPLLKGVTFTDDSIKINDYGVKGKYVFLDFWGSWCLPCLKTIEPLKALFESSDDAKIQFVGVDYETSQQGKTNAIKQLEKHNIPWPQVHITKSKTERSLDDLLDVVQYPTFLLISPEGRILAREIGEPGLKKIRETMQQLKLTNE